MHDDTYQRGMRWGMATGYAWAMLKDFRKYDYVPAFADWYEERADHKRFPNGAFVEAWESFMRAGKVDTVA